MIDAASTGALLSVWLLPVILAITLHEAAHAFAARALGDPTASELGRVSLNPLRHVDPIGTLLLPGALLLSGAPFVFGWAKPVPVDFRRLRRPKRDMVWVALAGPGINVALALAAALATYGAIYLPERAALWATQNLTNAMIVNVLLAVFNMLPIPPLDGGRVLTGLLPRPFDRYLDRVAPFGILLLLAVLLAGPFAFEALGLAGSPFAALIGPPFRLVFGGIASLAGLSCVEAGGASLCLPYLG